MLMKYMLLMYANESAQPQLTPEELSKLQKDWFAFMQEAKAAGVLVANNGLAPVASATTVRVRGGKTLTTDGPFAETHEQLAGFSLLECKDLDDAIGWATRIPMARFGSIEIRPLWDQV
jgi:hypothetical protein